MFWLQPQKTGISAEDTSKNRPLDHVRRGKEYYLVYVCVELTAPGRILWVIISLQRFFEEPLMKDPATQE